MQIKKGYKQINAATLSIIVGPPGLEPGTF